MTHNFLVKIHNFIDERLKFPNLKKGEVGIQIGFDLSSPNLTSDVWLMCNRVGKQGKVIGIDPDPANHEKIREIMNKYDAPVELALKATYSKTGKTKMVMAKRASWNKLDVIESEHSPNFTQELIDVNLDTVDNIIRDLNVNINSISHVNITNNGAEYDTLVGMKEILSKAKNISLTVIAGREGKMGVIDGKRDVDIISDFLKRYGFKFKYVKISQLFWWGFVHNLLLKRRCVYGKRNHYGVIMAHKGSKKTRVYQSFS
jgi:FkbM family methyltransferase